MGLPSKKDNLFVLKNVGRYQTELSIQQSHFAPDPNGPIKQTFPVEPKNYLERK